MTGQVRPICFPRSDVRLAACVQDALEAAMPEPLAAAVEALVRGTYPLASISVRHAMAALDGRLVWYVYRDGAFEPDPATLAPA
ncbi:hypothetical protein BH24CHL7_BH24CHL7_07600 [soil metagenome]